VNRARDAVALVVVLAFVMGSGTSSRIEEGPEPPTLTITVVEGSKEGAPCAPGTSRAIERLQGSAPDGVTVVAKLRVTASRPVKLSLMEDALAGWCEKRCVQGFSLLRAELQDGGDVVEVVAAAFRRGG